MCCGLLEQKKHMQRTALVLVHAGFIIQILAEEDGKELLKLVREAGLYG